MDGIARQAKGLIKTKPWAVQVKNASHAFRKTTLQPFAILAKPCDGLVSGSVIPACYFVAAACFGIVINGKSSVRNGEAGRPFLFHKLTSG